MNVDEKIEATEVLIDAIWIIREVATVLNEDTSYMEEDLRRKLEEVWS